MNSKALIRLNNEDVEISLVYPEDADLDEMKLSILSPIGTAIIGYRKGSSVEWEVPSGTSIIEIKEILYQPEAKANMSFRMWLQQAAIRDKQIRIESRMNRVKEELSPCQPAQL